MHSRGELLWRDPMVGYDCHASKNPGSSGAKPSLPLSHRKPALSSNDGSAEISPFSLRPHFGKCLRCQFGTQQVAAVH
jgi:hypothetical protein